MKRQESDPRIERIWNDEGPIVFVVQARSGSRRPKGSRYSGIWTGGAPVSISFSAWSIVHLHLDLDLRLDLHLHLYLPSQYHSPSPSPSPSLSPSPCSFTSKGWWCLLLWLGACATSQLQPVALGGQDLRYRLMAVMLSSRVPLVSAQSQGGYAFFAPSAFVSFVQSPGRERPLTHFYA